MISKTLVGEQTLRFIDGAKAACVAIQLHTHEKNEPDNSSLDACMRIFAMGAILDLTIALARMSREKPEFYVAGLHIAAGEDESGNATLTIRYVDAQASMGKYALVVLWRAYIESAEAERETGEVLQWLVNGAGDAH